MESQRTLFEPLRRLDPPRIGSYVLLGRLGAGAMGRVYLGRSAAGRLVAVKTIKQEFAEEDDFRARFAREVAAARRVSGVFTAAVVAADPDADVPWLATAYVPAPSLDRLVHTCGPLPVPAIRWLAAGCAEALASIHDAGLVHRDLKPSNVLVSPDGPRVIDFGVARAVEPAHLTSTYGSVGTPAYMAPEQARDTRQATTASDVFSLGSTLLFAASGHAPYQGQTAMDIMMRLATEPPDLSGLPAELADVVTGCLDRDPRKRPTSASLLGQLAPFVDAGIRRGFGSSLPDAALGLIEEYRHGPPPPAGEPGLDGDADPGGDAGESTFGSIASLAGAHAAGRAGAGGRPDGPPAGSADGAHERGGATAPPRGPLARAGLSRARRADRGGRGGPGSPGSRGARWGKTIAAAVTLALVTAGLVAGGSLLGQALDHHADSQGRRPPPQQFGPPGVPLAGLSPGGQGPPGPPPTGPHSLMLNQYLGDGYTTFVLHGSGWTPFSRITIRLVGGRASPYRPAVDLAGTFNYAINQTHEFFPGEIPPGNYQVVVTGSRGGSVEIEFTVHP
jgi:protein kinase-like protein